MVVNRYQIIKALGSDFEDLVILDIITGKMNAWLQFYEEYLINLRTTKNKRISVRNVADENNMSERTLYKIITFMETG